MAAVISAVRTVLYGIYGALISGILIFGAKQRNSTATLIWMVFAIIDVVWLIVVAVLAIIAVMAISSQQKGLELNIDVGSGMTILIIFIIFLGGLIVFKIWTLIVAKKTREEIQVPDEGIEIKY